MDTKLTKDMQGFYKDPIPGLTSMDYYSYSKISRYLSSPTAFDRYYIKGIKPPDTPAKEFGRILHQALLEPDKCNFIVEKKFSGTGSKKAKAEWLDNLDPGIQTVTQVQADKILYMLDSVNNHPEAVKYLKNSSRESKAYCYLDKFDAWFYFILDFVLNTKEGLIVGDLKTTANASPEAFSKDIYNYKYYVQAAIYIDLTEKLLGKKVDLYPIIAVENVEPFITEVYEIEGDLIEMGRQVYTKALGKLQNDIKLSKETDRFLWDGYTKGKKTNKISIPTWAYNKLINSEEYYNG